jgi:hypothetical protein
MVHLGRWIKGIAAVPFEINWKIEQRVFVVRLFGDVTADDVTQIGEESLRRVVAGVAPVHDVVDAREIGTFPINVQALAKATPHLRHYKIGWLVTINNNMLVQATSKLLARIAGTKYGTAQTMEEALRLLTHIDPTLAVPPHEVR